MHFKIHFVGLLIATSLISGCTLSFRSAPEEYSGSDVSRIRILDSGNTVIRFYTKEGSCYKKTAEKRLTSALAIMGMATTGSKKIAGMKPSDDIKGMLTKEYSIKPNQNLTVTHYYKENHTYGSFEREFSERFFPQPNHDYDIIVGDRSITIKDLSPSDNKSHTWDGDLCKTGLLDW
ncbi:hypothetical protein ACFFJN_01750 [Erwinia mallotivora]|uniref:hypothetical protein n=1 Tax=Erwinia mallotivora TaxID=69222 RepID=UPI0035E9B344